MTPWRTPTPRHTRRTRARRAAASGSAEAELLDLLEAALRPMLGETDPLDSEVVMSQALGLSAQRGHGRAVWDLLVDEAARRARRVDIAVLALLGELAWPADLRRRAASLVGHLAPAVGAPAWLPGLTPAHLGRCWVMADVFGDQANVVIECLRGPGDAPADAPADTSAHALVFLVDAAGRAPVVCDLFVTTECAATVARMGEYSANSEGLMRMGAADAHQWVARVARGLTGPWPHAVPGEGSLDTYWALALARLSDMGADLAPGSIEHEPTEYEPAQHEPTEYEPVPDAAHWVAQFVASKAGEHLRTCHGRDAAVWATALAHTCQELLGELPDHVSPVALDRVLPALRAYGSAPSASETAGSETSGDSGSKASSSGDGGTVDSASAESASAESASRTAGASDNAPVGGLWQAGPDGLGCLARAWVDWACTVEGYQPVAAQVLSDVLEEDMARAGVGPCTAPQRPATERGVVPPARPAAKQPELAARKAKRPAKRRPAA